MKVKLYMVWIALVLLSFMSCASTDRGVKVLHSDSELKSSNIYTLVVLPPILPAYLESWADAKKMTAEIWQIFHTEFRNEVMLLLADPQNIWQEILNWESTPKEWMFSGNRETAWKVANNLRADGFIMIHVEEWKEGGLAPASVKLRATLVKTKDNNTLLEISEGAKAKNNQAYISTRELAMEVSRDMAKRLLRAMKTGHASKSMKIPSQVAMGSTLIVTGLGTSFAALHAHNLAEESYNRYKSADNAVELEKYKQMTEKYDDLSILLGVGSFGLVSTGVALIFTNWDSFDNLHYLKLTPFLMVSEENGFIFSFRLDF